jgi:predicted Zn-dependent protease
LLARTDKLADAEKLLRELQQAHPENPSVAELQGRIALAKGHPREAITHFETALRNRKNNYITVQLATAQWQAGDTATGDNTLGTWISEYPEDLLTRFVLADALLSRGDYKAARNLYIEILSLAPENARTHNNLAWILLRENRPEDALAHAQRANHYQSGNADYMDTLALILLETGQTRQALNLLQGASRRAPDNLDTQFHLAKALAQDGQIPEARGILLKILADTQPFPERDAARLLLEELSVRGSAAWH